MSNPSSEFWESEPGRLALLRIMERGTDYWQTNVYKYFTRDTGKLGKSCVIRLDGTSVIVSMDPIYSINHGQIHEYGQNIRNGISPGKGKYSPVKGYRLKTGLYPGVPTGKFWDPWMAEFEPVLMNIVREEVRSGMKGFVKEQLRRAAV